MFRWRKDEGVGARYSLHRPARYPADVAYIREAGSAVLHWIWMRATCYCLIAWSNGSSSSESRSGDCGATFQPRRSTVRGGVSYVRKSPKCRIVLLCLIIPSLCIAAHVVSTRAALTVRETKGLTTSFTCQDGAKSNKEPPPPTDRYKPLPDSTHPDLDDFVRL